MVWYRATNCLNGGLVVGEIDIRKWKELRDSSEPPRTIPTDEQYKQDETGRLYRLPNDQLAQVPVQQKEGARDRGEAYAEPFNLVTLVELDDALREFSDKLIAIFRDVVLGVVNLLDSRMALIIILKIFIYIHKMSKAF